MKIYIGVDISKPRLDVDWQGKSIDFENNPSGIKKLIAKLQKLNEQDELSSVVLEASGGYERKLVQACHDNHLPVHVAHANKVRSFAKSKGILAKTDKLDAAILSDYGCLMKVRPDKVLLTENAEKIRLLLGRREQLMKDRQREKNRLDKLEKGVIKSSGECPNKHLYCLSNNLRQFF